MGVCFGLWGYLFPPSVVRTEVVSLRQKSECARAKPGLVCKSSIGFMDFFTKDPKRSTMPTFQEKEVHLRLPVLGWVVTAKKNGNDFSRKEMQGIPLYLTPSYQRKFKKRLADLFLRYLISSFVEWWGDRP